MNRHIICVLVLQFSLINCYVDFPDTDDTMGGDRWCQHDQDCMNPFVECTHIGYWEEGWGNFSDNLKRSYKGWGKCRIPWDFGTECKTDLDCVRGSTCDALYCHGPSTRGPDPVLRKGLKKYCHCTTPRKAPRNGADVDDLMIVSDPSQPANLMGKRRRRSLKRRREELLTMIKKWCVIMP
eukprot:05145.XXX_140652_140010_1 [CDS] Oithona nana genome sequencing.